MKDKKNLSVGIDLGTSNLLIYVEGQGTLFNEPSIIAIDKATGNVVSVGYEAAKLEGRTQGKVGVARHCRGGAIQVLERIGQIFRLCWITVFLTILIYIAG